MGVHLALRRATGFCDINADAARLGRHGIQPGFPPPADWADVIFMKGIPDHSMPDHSMHLRLIQQAGVLTIEAPTP